MAYLGLRLVRFLGGSQSFKGFPRRSLHTFGDNADCIFGAKAINVMIWADGLDGFDVFHGVKIIMQDYLAVKREMIFSASSLVSMPILPKK